MRLQNRVALVTGAARGIGKAIAIRFAAEGAAVIVSDIDRDEAQRTTAEITANGGQAMMIYADVSRREDVETLVADALEAYGQIDILVNNAGIINRDTVLEVNEDAFAQVFDVNIGGCYRMTQVVARHMVERGQGGHIINLSSGNAIIGCYNRSIYAATKGAIEAFTRASAVELAQHGIHVNAVAPGFTNTEINAQFFNEQVLNAIQTRVAIGRVAESVEVANTVLALAAGDLSYMVGQVLRVDGGWTACDIDYTQLGKNQ